MSTPDERPVRDPATWTAPPWEPPSAGVIDLREQSRPPQSESQAESRAEPQGEPERDPQGRPRQDSPSSSQRPERHATSWDLAADDEPADERGSRRTDQDAASDDDGSEADVPQRPGDASPYDDGRTSLLGLEDGPELSLSDPGTDRMPWESGPLSGYEADLGYTTDDSPAASYGDDPLGSAAAPRETPEHAPSEAAPAAPAPSDVASADALPAAAAAAPMVPTRRPRSGEPTWVSGSRTVPVEGRRMSADDLRIRRGAVEPAQRRGVRRMLGGGGDAQQAEQRRRDRLAKLRAPLPEGHRLAVVSLKGGVGKTTATAVLGATLATLRTDRIVAIDANPDRGTLAEKVDRTTDATVRDLIHAGDRLNRYSTVQTYINQTESRLEVLASESDPAASHALDEADYSKALDVLERYYNVILTDCGTGLLHAATRAALSNADSVVVVSSASMDGARSASATLDWLEAHGREDLARSAVAIVNEIRPDVDPDDVRQIEEHFAARCRAVERVPYDPHLAAGDVISLDELLPETREAFERVATAVVGGAAVGG